MRTLATATARHGRQWLQNATAHASRRSRQRHQSSGNGDLRLVWRQDDDVVPMQHAERAGAGVFSDLELEQSRQIVERDHFVPIALERVEHVSPG